MSNTGQSLMGLSRSGKGFKALVAGKTFHQPQTIQLAVQCSTPHDRMAHFQPGLMQVGLPGNALIYLADLMLCML